MKPRIFIVTTAGPNTCHLLSGMEHSGDLQAQFHLVTMRLNLMII